MTLPFSQELTHRTGRMCRSRPTLPEPLFPILVDLHQNSLAGYDFGSDFDRFFQGFRTPGIRFMDLKLALALGIIITESFRMQQDSQRLLSLSKKVWRQRRKSTFSVHYRLQSFSHGIRQGLSALCWIFDLNPRFFYTRPWIRTLSRCNY